MVLNSQWPINVYINVSTFFVCLTLTWIVYCKFHSIIKKIIYNIKNKFLREYNNNVNWFKKRKTYIDILSIFLSTIS